MLYHSTRGQSPSVDSAEAVLQGLAPDGGLYMPEKLPEFDWQDCLTGSSMDMSTKILSALLSDIPDMPRLVKRAYTGKFETDDLTPTVPVGDFGVLELFRGPTSAFKDVALSMLPQLLTAAKAVKGMDKDILILTATSGDTGKAALEGFHDVPGVRICVFYPDGGVSQVQRAQMVTQEGGNVAVCAVRGNFDDAQTGVKRVFADETVAAELEKRNIRLSSANSINWGRLAPQIVYYFYAYFRLAEQGAVAWGEPVDFCVPTGNFGDILAGYYAKQMGLPVGKLVCASNKNNVLTDFIRTGTYDARRTFYKTTSPSMDILISSNLERLLYHVSGSSEKVAAWMQELAQTGKYTVDVETLAKIQQNFAAGFAGDEEGAEEIRARFEQDRYLCDTHTAVAFRVAETCRSAAPMVVLSTASPFKFPRDVLAALGTQAPESDFAAMSALTEATGEEAPVSLRQLDKLPVRFTEVIAPDAIRAAALR